MKRLFQLWKYKLSLYKRNVWYNHHLYVRDKYPIVFDGDGKYIPCEIGARVLMGTTACGKKIYYKISDSWQERPWADWLYSSDAIHCDMIFSHVE